MFDDEVTAVHDLPLRAPATTAEIHDPVPQEPEFPRRPRAKTVKFLPTYRGRVILELP